MRKFSNASLSLAVLASTFLFSCEKGISVVDPNDSSDSQPVQNAAVSAARLSLAKALAKGMQEKDVRSFIKTEALSMYDGDYDVVYALVKDKVLANGQTLEKTLAKYATTDEVRQWNEADPLATIFVPSLTNFTPQTWDVETQVPDVVFDDSDIREKGAAKFVAFTKNLNQYEVSKVTAPTSPVIVVKENERIIAKNKADIGSRKSASLLEQKSTVTIAQNSTHNFYFTGDYNFKKKDQNARRNASRRILDQLTFYNYHKSSRPQIPGNERDWVYYKIWPYFNEIELVNPNINGGVDYDWSKGSLGGTYYTEKLTGFKFANAERINSAADWMEGYLEFHVIFSFVHRTGGMTSDLKVFGCSIDQLRDGSGNPVDFDPDVELMGWDMYRYGDEWKFTVLENDPGGSTQTTVTSKSNFGYNFEASGNVNFFSLIKFNGKFGTTGNFEKTESSVITISNQSEQLGDARFKFDDPVILGHSWPNRYGVSTGSVTLAIEPVSKNPDPRPDPYID